MKKQLLILLLTPLLSYGQTQIGQDIDGEFIGDQSGDTVSLSSDGTIVAIGAPTNDGNGSNSGQVRVYENINGTWTQLGQDIDGEAANDDSGDHSISLSSDGSIVAIGAIRNDGNGMTSGHVRIYENINGIWTQLGQDIDGEFEGDASGRAVSLSSDGSIVAIGAPGNDEYGHVRIFSFDGNSWNQMGEDIDGEMVYGTGSGNSLSLSDDGSIVAIADQFNDENGIGTGHVRVFSFDGNSWNQVGQDIDGENFNDELGSSVSLSSDGTILAIGIRSSNTDNGGSSGSVKIFNFDGTTWIQIGQDINGEATSDESGSFISLSSNGSIVAIGAPFNDTTIDNTTIFNTGHVRVYQNQSGNWVQVGQDIDGIINNDRLGSSVSLSSDGTILAIGNPSVNNNNPGHVKIFDLSGVLSTEEVIQTQFSIFPNPASTNVTIQLDQNSVLERATIYNSLGELVKTSIETTIDTSDLSKGIYILEVKTNQGKASRKLIIE